jgi:hypothetical protein
MLELLDRDGLAKWAIDQDHIEAAILLLNHYEDGMMMRDEFNFSDPNCYLFMIWDYYALRCPREKNFFRKIG